MKYQQLVPGIAAVQSEEVLLCDVQSALDFILSAQYETGCNKIIVPKSCVAEGFFVLSSGIAGEILQKFINYKVQVAIVGDFSSYTSKPLQDFIYESNKGKHVFFVSTTEQAVEKLAQA